MRKEENKTEFQRLMPLLPEGALIDVLGILQHAPLNEAYEVCRATRLWINNRKDKTFERPEQQRMFQEIKQVISKRIRR